MNRRPLPSSIVESVDIFAETVITIADNEIDGLSSMNLGEGTSAPLTAAISPNFRFITDQTQPSQLRMEEKTPSKSLNNNEQRTPPSGPPRRNLFSVSPTKQVSRKRQNEEKIQTLIFFDFETSGLFSGAAEPKKNYSLRKSRCPADFATELEKLILETQKDCYPRVLEFSFVAVPRESFEKHVKRMENLRDYPQGSSIRVRIPCNIHTRQINPNMKEAEWAQYERIRKQNPLALVFEKNDLHLKNSFEVEWKQVKQFLDSCPKPACLIAHNGLYFDFRLLHGEMARYNLLESDPLPKGVYFLDSLLAVQNIEDSLKQRLVQTLQGIDWNLITRLTISDEMDQEGEIIPRDHPLNFLNKSEWPTALFRRFTHSDFKKSPSGQWEFSPSGKRHSLKTVYDSIIGNCGQEFHYAQDDSEALLQICLAFGEEFLQYMDSSAAEVPF